jgi:excisionase family DNA binding protein
MSHRTLPRPMTIEELRSRLTISLPEAAALLGVSRPHIYNLANRGALPLIHLGGRKVVSAPLLLQRLTTPEFTSEDQTA